MKSDEPEAGRIMRGREPPPDTGAFDTAACERGARVPCTRDDGDAEDGPAGEVVWAYVLGKTICERRCAFARVLAESVVRLHIREGHLEAMIAQPANAIDVHIDDDALFAAFIEGWQMFAVDLGRARRADSEAISIFVWKAPITGADTGWWERVRNGTRSMRAVTTCALLEAAQIGLEQAVATIERGGNTIESAERLALVADLVTGEFVTRYEAQIGARLPLEQTQATRNATAALKEPWRGALIEAVARAQGRLRSRAATQHGAAEPTLQ